ncbi:hypothetical protein BDN72DRAFT_301732 [Pluteus cervinus]|uniref:Uncharacterized protein n=1 Tax=Pluteus cervinus TaxID=181527 RepID=A0ACD3ACY4_9AGAR|nr:hypothetical protein BDN72DRAFT_301732 [Pluteus cervinus]
MCALTAILSIGMPPSQTSSPFEIKAHAFTAIPHPMGTLALSSTYLTNPNFQLDELESLLSSRFLSEGPDFVPTLMKNQAQRSSLMTTASSPGGMGIPNPGNTSAAAGVVSGSPGTAAGRAFPTSFQSKSKSPPESIADRFIITARVPPQSHDPTSQPNTTDLPRLGTMHARHASNPSPYTSGTSTSAFPVKDEGPYSRPPSALSIARIRRESAGTGDLPNSPSASTFSSPGTGGPASTTPLPIRRPHISGGVNPFKSNTLSSPSSLHSSSPRGSPLGGITTTPNIGSTGRASPAPRVPHSPIGLGIGSPATSNRPSPPFTPSSLGDRRSNASAEGGEEGMMGARPVPARKRYSSSFGHRYAPAGSPASGTGVAGPGSEGSAGSGGGMAAAMVERKDGSFLATNTDEDDISIFVHDIDSRKPLSGRHRLDREKQQGDEELLLALRRATLEDEAGQEGAIDDRHDDHGTQRQLGKLPLGAGGSPESGVPQLHDRFARQPLGADDGIRRRPLAPSGLGVVIGAKMATASGSGSNPLLTPTPDSLTPRTTAIVGSPPGVVLTNQADIDEKLRRMNENFFTSLEGLGSGKDRSQRSGNETGRGGHSSVGLLGHGHGGGGSDGDGVGSAITDSAGGMGTSGSASGSGSGSGGSDAEAVFGRRYPLGKPFVERRRHISTSDSTTGSIGMGSQEVIGRMEF